MAVNQVIVNGEELVNLRNDSVTPQTLVEGETATNREGEHIQGELDPVSHDEAYLVDDPEGDIDDSDYIPFNDVSDEEEPKKKTLFSSIITKLRGIFATKTGDNITDKDTFRQNIHTLEWLGTDIPDNADLDTYTTAGNYRVVSDGSGATIANLPLALCGKVIVFNNGNSGIEQFYFANHSPRIFVRTKFGSDAWSAWKELGEGGDSKTHTYERGTAIPENSDLDTYLTQGIYFVGSDVSSRTISNVPVQSAGKLIVVESINSSNYRIQIYQMLTGKIFIRYYSVGEGGWQEWKVISSGAHTYEDGIAIPADSDLNDYKTAGVYYVSNATDASTISNIPVSSAGKLIVMDRDTGARLFQIYMVSRDEIYMRDMSNDSVFSAWRNITRQHTYETGERIPASSDLNTYTSIGVYQVRNNSDANTISNIPITYAGKLIVSQTFSDNNVKKQTYLVYNSDAIYVRTTTDNGTNWTSWKQLASTDDLKPHTYEVGTSIPASSDLNTYIVDGVYKISPDATAQTIVNIPSHGTTIVGGKLIVSKGYSSNENYIIQTYIANDAFIYVRRSSNNGTSWSVWKQLASTNDVYNVLDASLGTEILANSDLNDYKTFGVYRYSAGNASTISNRPLSADEAIVLWVMRSWDNSYIRQIAFMRNTQRIATRTFRDNTTWEEWKALAYQDEITPSMIGNGYAVATVSGSAITATISGFKLRAGVIVAIKIGGEITSACTLNISSTGAKPIKFWNNEDPTYGKPIGLGCINTMIYDGTYYRIISLDRTPHVRLQDYVADTSGNLVLDWGYQSNRVQLKYALSADKLTWNRYKNSAWRGDLILADYNDLGASIAKVGKNILPSWGYTTNVRTANGITFTFNPSTGEITVNGTATADTSCVLAGNNTTYGYRIPKGSYVLSGCPSGGANNKYFIALQYHDSEFHSQLDYGNGTSFTLNNDVYCKVSDNENYYILIRSGQTVSNMVFKPMLRPAFTTADYEPCEDISKGNCYVGRCETAGATKDKVAYVDGYFVLRKGVRVAIKFTNTNTYSNVTSSPITLNVNDTGAKNIWYASTHSGAGNTGTSTTIYGVGGRYHYYVYDGTYWVFDSHSMDNNNTNYLRNDASSIAKVNDASPYITLKSSVVDITQSNNGVSSTSYPAFIIEDKNGKCLSRLETNVEANGNVATYLQVRNYKSDGTNPNGGIKVFMNKNGGIWYVISSPQNFNASTGIGYGTCATAANEKDKVVTLSNFVLTVGGIIGVKFSNTNTYSATADNKVTLNVNNTGAKPIYYNTGYPTGTNTTAFGTANRINYYMYNGTDWCWLNYGYEADTTDPRVLGFGYGTCTTAEATTAKVVTLASYSLRNGGYVSVKFSYNVPANSTMNINNRGAKEIWHRGAKITANKIKAGDLATFVYDGTRYHLVANDRYIT